MHYAVLKLQSLRDACRRVLPERWVSPPLAHPEGLWPRKASAADMEVKPGSPASSWVAWEVGPRQRRGRGWMPAGAKTGSGTESEKRKG